MFSFADSAERMALVLTGGGARGAYQAGALLAISETVHARSLPFRILSGSSAGSLTVAYLASRANEFVDAARSLADLWSTIEPSLVFRTDAATLAKTATGWVADLGFGGWIGTGRGRSLLDTAPMRQLIAAHFDPDALHYQLEVGRVHGVGVTASSYQTGLGVTFFDGSATILPWSRVTRLGVRARLTVDHVMASAAIPFFFPAVSIDESWYADGCIRLTTPLSPAIRMGADRILAIAVRSLAPAQPRIPAQALTALPTYPTTAESAGVLFNALFLDALESDIERADRINRTLSLLPREVVDGHAVPLRPVSVLVLGPSVDPGALVLKTIDHFPAVLRHLFRGLGATENAGWELLSYLAFDGAYTTRLLQLGYEDTIARADEIRAFLT
jgi:NTE family protein